MKIHAYVLAGDPAWIEQSIGSFYGMVDRIVVSFDADGLSWSGHALSTEESIARIAAVDPDGKVVLRPGRFSNPDLMAMWAETAQRQDALDAASEGADWVLQLDTDEVVTDPGAFRTAIDSAESHAASALEYPARVLYARARSGRFLEISRRFWTTQSSYPGPVAVRAGTRLSHARQAAGVPTFRVDVSAWNTDPARPATTPVHAVIPRQQALLHLSWVRTEAQMAEKRAVSGHAAGRDWDRELDRWRRRMRHPFVAAAGAPLSRRPFERFRVTSLPRFARLAP
ncbi:MAG: hypothetical protein ACTHNQ_09085 [Microbacterium sp.]|uniref:hypothetical protein n=1 Tax=Microbacterium sp. TaxID=51671 RepID=UPI003F821AD7